LIDIFGDGNVGTYADDIFIAFDPEHKSLDKVLE
jgi:hypothetical protein